MAKLARRKVKLKHLVCVLGDSQLMIRYIIWLFKKLSHHSIYWDIEQPKNME